MSSVTTPNIEKAAAAVSLNRQMSSKFIRTDSISSVKVGGGVSSSQIANKQSTKKNKLLISPQKSISSIDIPGFNDWIDYKNGSTRQKLIKQWKLIIKIAASAQLLSRYVKTNADIAKKLVSQLKKRYFASQKIAVFAARKAYWVRYRLARRSEIFKKHGWIIILYAKCVMRRKAILAIRNFFIDNRNFRLAYMMLRYRTNAIQLQKRVRSFIQVTSARVEILTKLWSKYEKQIRDHLLPKVKSDQLLLAKIALAERKAEQWESNKIETVANPTLGLIVNKATKSAIQLKNVMKQGEDLAHRVHMEELNRQIQKQKSPTKSKGSGEVRKKRKKKKKKKTTGGNVIDMSAKEKIIRDYLYECRRSFKIEDALETQKRNENNKEAIARLERVSHEMATGVLRGSEITLDSIENTVSNLFKNQILKNHFCVYTGENSGKFYCLVEDHVRQKLKEMMLLK